MKVVHIVPGSGGTFYCQNCMRDGALVQALRRAEHEKPDLIHISNALLIGLAAEIKAVLNVPVVCSLQDEDGWLDQIDPPYNEKCWAAIRERTKDVDQFVAVSHWFADRMSERLEIPREQIEVVHIGIDLEGFKPATLDFNPPVLGYLSRMNESLGLEKLVDAFIELKQCAGLENLQLRATGGLVGDDYKCVARLQKKLAKKGFEKDAEFIENFSREQRLAFLKSLSVLCVPVEQGEAFGTYIIEAMAAGVPVVQPNAGAFPELISATGGGVIYKNLTDSLRELLTHPDQARKLATKGRENVYEKFDVNTMAQNTRTLYQTILNH